MPSDNDLYRHLACGQTTRRTGGVEGAEGFCAVCLALAPASEFEEATEDPVPVPLEVRQAIFAAVAEEEERSPWSDTRPEPIAESPAAEDEVPKPRRPADMPKMKPVIRSTGRRR